MYLSVNNSESTLNQLFTIFLTSCAARGLKEKTISSYKSHFAGMARFLDIHMDARDLKQYHIDQMVLSLRNLGVSANTIKSYLRVLRTFSNWAADNDFFHIKVPSYKGEDTIKDPYNNEELLKLLAKPNKNTCSFNEYRTWVIINFLLDTGCRAGTLRNIQNKDVNLTEKTVIYQHTKNRKQQLMPISSTMVSILIEYIAIRKGDLSDYLFCDEYGGQLSEYALRRSIWRYNRRRGVQKTSIHLFRHTFAKKYLLDCKGNAFALQRLLGHSTMDVTKHYCAIYNADLFKDYDLQSPLALLTQEKQLIKHKNKPVS